MTRKWCSPEKKSTVPILSHVLVEASATGLRLAATDLELGIRTFCPAQVKVPGSAAAPARRLLGIVRSPPEGEVRVGVLENHWTFASRQYLLKSASAFLRKSFRPSLASLVFRCLFHSRCDCPHVPSGVLDPAHSVAPELGLNRHHKLATAL